MVTCSVCGKSIEELGGLYSGSRVEVHGTTTALAALDQWLANVCLRCRKVYCPECLKLGGPTPCPTCGDATVPAQRMHLERIGLSP